MYIRPFQYLSVPAGVGQIGMLYYSTEDYKQSMAWLTYLICNNSAEWCLFKDTVCLNKQAEKGALTWVESGHGKKEWNKTTSFDSQQELKPQVQI